MTFLPIVERELRVAARRKSTYLTRLMSALVGLIITGVFLSLQSRTNSMLTGGRYLFMALAWLSFIFVCFAGIILTCDAVSQERREGTLGLLFLTDLRGYDIIFGKLMANSLQSFYGLLALFPVLALPLLMGGVTAGEFWRMILVLVNGLFFSLALGIFVSSINRDSQKALQAAFFLSALFIMGAPMLDPFFKWKSSPLFFLSCVSPGMVFLKTIKKDFQDFWLAIVISNAVGWSFLILASYFTPRFWRQGNSGAKGELRAKNGSFRSRETRQKLRARLLDKNPVCWLNSRRPGSGRVLRFVLYGLLTILFIEYVRDSGSNNIFGLSQGLHLLVICGVDIWMASQAALFFVEGCRTGSVELLLCTPVTTREIIQGQWLALRRLFFFPAVLVLLMQVLFAIIQMRYFAKMNIGTGVEWMYYQFVSLLSGMVSFIVGLAALGWVGMWMGLATKKSNMAVMKTFVFVVIIPWFAVMIVQLFISFPMARLGAYSGVVRLIITMVLWLCINVGFIIWARRNLHSQLRELVSSGVAKSTSGKPPFAFFREPKIPPVIAQP